MRASCRAVLNIGERVPDGTTTHRILGEIWVWSEADVRRMVEQAGFIDLSIEYASSAGESRMLEAVDRVTGALGQDLRIVHATKPTQPGQ